MADKQDLQAIRRRARKLLRDIDAFPDLVEDFIAASGVSRSRLSVAFYGSHTFTHHLSHGRDFRLSTLKKVLSLLAQGA